MILELLYDGVYETYTVFLDSCLQRMWSQQALCDAFILLPIVWHHKWFKVLYFSEWQKAILKKHKIALYDIRYEFLQALPAFQFWKDSDQSSEQTSMGSILVEHRLSSNGLHCWQVCLCLVLVLMGCENQHLPILQCITVIYKRILSTVLHVLYNELMLDLLNMLSNL